MFVRTMDIIFHFSQAKDPCSQPFNDNFIALAHKRLNVLRNDGKKKAVERRLRIGLQKSLCSPTTTFDLCRKLHRSVARGSLTIFDPLARREEEIKALARNL